MIYVDPGQTFSAVLEGASGATSISVRIERTDGTTFFGPTSDGILEVEPGSGVFVKSDFVAPTDKGTYVIMWVADGAVASEELRVSRDEVAPGIVAYAPATYASPEELVAYLPSGTVLDDDEANKLLAEASRDIDSAVGGWEWGDDGSKFGAINTTNPTGLSNREIINLNRATLHQARYRLQMGEDFFIEDQRESVSGPDGSETGKLKKIGPMARRELQQSGLMRLGGRMT